MMMTFPSRSKSSTHTRGPSYLIPTASGAENLISRDQDRLAPKDVKNGLSPTRSPRSSREGESISEHSEKPVDKPAHASRRSSSRHTRDRRRNGGKKKTRSWRKLLWVDQDYPDNYTDEATFLAELKWNPRFRPYEFWSLLFDSAVIIQQLCSLVIFICCFVGIFQERVSPVLIVGVGSLCTLLGWFIQDQWRSRQGDGTKEAPEGSSGQKVSDERVHEDDAVSPREAMAGLGLTNALVRSRATLPSISTTSLPYGHSSPSSSIHSAIGDDIRSPRTGDYGNLPPHPPQILENSRNQERLAIAKSAVLIFAALLGLSPILKSLTRSTSSDSIWAGSCWLFVMNLFFFDYGSVSEARIPASLSTNAAVMASTVLASRLPSTTHVFSLTLFSIEVFGLFPVFRRHLHHNSPEAHVALTAALVLAAGGSLGVILTGSWIKAAVLGALLGALGTMLVMGGCCWWLISLQQYKNEIHGPWDPARPIVRPRWD